MTTEAVPGLADRYHQLMKLRHEGLNKYRATEFSVLAGPRSHVTFPLISLQGKGKRRIGPLRFEDRAPIFDFVERAIREFTEPGTVLEIGPGNGDLARLMLSRHRHRIAAYLGYDRDPSQIGEYQPITSLDDAGTAIDLVVASEVVEHMTADVLLDSYLRPLSQKMNYGGTFIASTPNPVSPGGIARDITHVQNYPWYDLYALLRLVFRDVSIYRTYYLFHPSRIATLLPRIALCSLLEMDWRDGIVCVARSPLRFDSPQRSSRGRAPH